MTTRVKTYKKVADASAKARLVTNPKKKSVNAKFLVKLQSAKSEELQKPVSDQDEAYLSSLTAEIEGRINQNAEIDAAHFEHQRIEEYLLAANNGGIATFDYPMSMPGNTIISGTTVSAQ